VGWVSASYDLAIIEIATSNKISDLGNSRPMELATAPLKPGKWRCSAVGFPEASGSDDRMIEASLQWVVRGTRFDVDVSGALPRDAVSWAGFSGAVLFCDEAALAVICTVDTNWNGKLGATPVQLLIEDADFRDYWAQRGNAPLAPIRILEASAETMRDRLNISGDVHHGVVISGNNNAVYVYYERAEQSTTVPAIESIDHAQRASNPYKGLLYFEETDANRFFGRETLTSDLYARLVELLDAEEGRPRILPVLGPSGSGKSSLVRAGLVPRLARERLEKLIEPRVLVLTPGPRPLEALARALARFATGDVAPVAKTEEFLEALNGNNRGGPNRIDGLRRIVDALPKLGPPRLILVIDQFEELYVTPAAPKEREIFEAERDQFVATLMDAATDRGGRMVALVAMRSDFLGATQRHPELNTQITRSGFLVPGLSKPDLEDAIVKPAELGSPPYRFPEAFVGLLVSEVLGRPGALPLLQFALQQVWEALPEDPAVTLEKLGGVGGSVAVEAETVFDRLSETDQAIARRAFLAMVNLGEGALDTRRRANLDEITTDPASIEREHFVLARFARPDARLITLNQEQGGAVTFEVAHETLIQRWNRLREWLDQGRDDQRFLYRAREAAARWAEGKGSLWQSFELEQLREFAQRVPDDMTAGLTRFLHASLADQKTIQLRQRRQRWLLRSWSIAATILFIAACCFGWISSNMTKVARTQRAIAEARQRESIIERDNARQAQSRVLAARASEELQENPALSYLIAAQGVPWSGVEGSRERPEVPEARYALDLAGSLLNDGRLSAPFPAYILGMDGQGRALAVALNPSDASSGDRPMLRSGSHHLVQLTIAPPGREVFARQVIDIPLISNKPPSLRLSADGQRAVLSLPANEQSSTDQMLTIASIGGQPEVRTLTPNEPVLDLDGDSALKRQLSHFSNYIKISSNELTAAAIMGDASVIVWALRSDPAAGAPLARRETPVADIDLSADGREVALAFYNGGIRTASLQGANNWTLSPIIVTPGASVARVVFSHSGRYIMGISTQELSKRNILFLWEYKGQEHHSTVLGLRDDSIQFAAFTPDDSRVIVASHTFMGSWEVDEMLDPARRTKRAEEGIYESIPFAVPNCMSIAEMTTLGLLPSTNENLTDRSRVGPQTPRVDAHVCPLAAELETQLARVQSSDRP
jgi:hypothetical protein